MGWTDEEISTLASMWPKASVAQIAARLNRSCSNISYRATRLREKGLLKTKLPRRSRSIKPDPQDFAKVKRDYCSKHHITVAELSARFESDDKLAAQLYRLAQAAKLTRLRPRRRE